MSKYSLTDIIFLTGSGILLGNKDYTKAEVETRVGFGLQAINETEEHYTGVNPSITKEDVLDYERSRVVTFKVFDNSVTTYREAVFPVLIDSVKLPDDFQEWFSISSDTSNPSKIQRWISEIVVELELQNGTKPFEITVIDHLSYMIKTEEGTLKRSVILEETHQSFNMEVEEDRPTYPKFYVDEYGEVFTIVNFIRTQTDSYYILDPIQSDRKKVPFSLQHLLDHQIAEDGEGIIKVLLQNFKGKYYPDELDIIRNKANHILRYAQ